jgi:chromosome segregation ATPase
MADPPAGPPEPLATTDTQGTVATDASESLEPTVARRTRRQTRAEDDQTNTNPPITEPTNAGATSGRVTTKEIRQIIEQLQHTINKQTVLIQATRNELREVKDNQNELQAQNKRLQEEVQALRTQIDGLNAPNLTRSWATVAANADNPEPRKDRRQAEKEKNCVRISTQRSPVDSSESEDSANAFGRYLPTPAANTYIRTALRNAPSTQEVQVAGIRTTKTRYIIRFKDSVSAETARQNTE